jgi:hypothetical protein
MRQFWSMRSNKRQHFAQSLRFEWSTKTAIIQSTPNEYVRLRCFLLRPDAGRKALKSRSGDKSCIPDLVQPIAAQKEASMAETVVKLRLNQQQLELMDRTIAQGVAADRVALVRLALREYAASRKAAAETAR